MNWKIFAIGFAVFAVNLGLSWLLPRLMTGEIVPDKRWIPTLSIALNLASATAYGWAWATAAGDWRKVVYWLAAATLTAVVTW